MRTAVAERRTYVEGARSGSVFGSLEFHDFDQFRQWIRGWDTDPFQLTTGPLRIRYDSIGSDDLTFARLRSNQRVSDSHAVEPGSIALVLALSPKRWCGIDVSPGSLVVMGPGPPPGPRESYQVGRRI
jgi:hypothetical protein